MRYKLEMSAGPKFPARPQIFLFVPARPGINILQNLYKGLNFLLFLQGKAHCPNENFVKYGLFVIL